MGRKNSGDKLASFNRSLMVWHEAFTPITNPKLALKEGYVFVVQDASCSCNFFLAPFLKHKSFLLSDTHEHSRVTLSIFVGLVSAPMWSQFPSLKMFDWKNMSFPVYIKSQGQLSALPRMLIQSEDFQKCTAQKTTRNAWHKEPDRCMETFT